MNKQEKELLISFVNSAKEDLNFSFGICQKTYHGYVQGNQLINYIEQLNESEENLASTIKLLTNLEPDDFLKELKLYGLAKEPQKVKVPEEFDEWYKQIERKWKNDDSARSFALWKICQYGFGNGFEDVNHNRAAESLREWVDRNREDAINAIWNGYEVEESKWVVKRADSDYVTSFNQSLLNTNIDVTSSLDCVSYYKFTDLKKAEAVATLVDGSVEEV